MERPETQSAVGSTRLLACPFCNAGIYGVGYERHKNTQLWFVWCWNCGATTGKRGDKQQVIDMWNRLAR